MNIYVIASNDKVTLDEKIKELNKKGDAEVVFYDLIDTNIDRLIEDLNTYNLLANKKIIVGTNAVFLSSERTKSNVEHNLESLERYLDNPSSDNVLILVTDTIDKRKKITSTVLKKAELIEEIADINKIIKKRLDGYKISDKTISKLCEYCGNNHERIFNEIEKLKLYKINEKEITDKDIEDIVIQVLDDNIFHFIDSILSGNKEYAFKLYNNFMLHGEQIVHLIILLSNKIRLMYQVKVLYNKGNSDKAISGMLKVHEYPVKLAREAGYKYSESKLLEYLEKLAKEAGLRYSNELLLEYLEKLAKIDQDIKSGESTGEVEFETLLASI